MSDTDGYYVERCLDGHPDDFRFLVRRYQKALMAYLAGKLYSLEMAEEAAQESFVRAYFNMERLKKPDSFFSWLLGVGDRVAKEMKRSRQIEQKREFIEASTEKVSQAEFSANYSLEAAISELPEAYREVILLRYYGGQSCNDIAEKLCVPLGTVTKQLSRAYAMLRDKLRCENSNSEVSK